VDSWPGLQIDPLIAEPGSDSNSEGSTVARMATPIDGAQLPLTDLARAAEASESALARLRALSVLIDRAEQERRAAAAQARRTGASWAQMAEQLGTSRQAAQQRYGSKPAKEDQPVGARDPSMSSTGPRPMAPGVGDWEIATRGGRVLLVLRRIRRRQGQR
jgi:hypothetical protein